MPPLAVRRRPPAGGCSSTIDRRPDLVLARAQERVLAVARGPRRRVVVELAAEEHRRLLRPQHSRTGCPSRRGARVCRTLSLAVTPPPRVPSAIRRARSSEPSASSTMRGSSVSVTRPLPSSNTARPAQAFRPGSVNTTLLGERGLAHGARDRVEGRDEGLALHPPRRARGGSRAGSGGEDGPARPSGPSPCASRDVSRPSSSNANWIRSALQEAALLDVPPAGQDLQAGRVDRRRLEQDPLGPEEHLQLAAAQALLAPLGRRHAGHRRARRRRAGPRPRSPPRARSRRSRG